MTPKYSGSFKPRAQARSVRSDTHRKGTVAEERAVMVVLVYMLFMIRAVRGSTIRSFLSPFLSPQGRSRKLLFTYPVFGSEYGWTENPRVVGSIPTLGTILARRVRSLRLSGPPRLQVKGEHASTSESESRSPDSVRLRLCASEGEHDAADRSRPGLSVRSGLRQLERQRPAIVLQGRCRSVFQGAVPHLLQGTAEGGAAVHVAQLLGGACRRLSRADGKTERTCTQVEGRCR